MLNVHATLVSLNGKGILIQGKSGSGKSDLALRLILEHGAVLVADDRVNLEVKETQVWGNVPQETAGKLEVRGIGIAEMPFLEKAEIALVVELVEKNEIERMPIKEMTDILGISVEKIRLFAFESSATCKIVVKISRIISSLCL